MRIGLLLILLSINLNKNSGQTEPIIAWESNHLLTGKINGNTNSGKKIADYQSEVSKKNGPENIYVTPVKGENIKKGDKKTLFNQDQPYFFDLPDYQYGAYIEVYYNIIQGSININQKFNPGIWSCFSHFSFDPQFENKDLNFEKIKFQIDSSGYYSIYTIPDTSEQRLPQFNIYSALYSNLFNKENPCENLIQTCFKSYYPNPLGKIGLTDSTPIGLINDSFNLIAPWLMYPYEITKIDAYLERGKKYEILITTLNNTQSGNFKIFIFRNDKNAKNALLDLTTGNKIPTIKGLEFYDFFCNDENYLKLTETETISYNLYKLGGLNSDISDFGFSNGGEANSYFLKLLSKLFSVDETKDTLQKLATLPSDFNELFQYKNGIIPFVYSINGGWEVEIKDVSINFGECGFGPTQNIDFNISRKLKRIFSLKNKEDNNLIDSDSVEITLRNPSFKDLSYPNYNSNFTLSEYNNIVKLGNGNPSPQSSGTFYVKTFGTNVKINHGATFCNIGASFQDIAKVITGTSTFNFRREWTIYDWCRPGTSLVFNQLIRIIEDPIHTICTPQVDYTNTIPPAEWQTADCDGDGELNLLELINGSDPYDACSRYSNVPAPPQWTNLPSNISLTCEEALNFNLFTLNYSTNIVESCIQTGSINATKSSNFGICGEVWTLTWSFTDLFGQSILHQQSITVSDQECTSTDFGINIPEIALQSQTIANRKSIESRSRITNGNKVNFFAGESITLRPGFKVDPGGEFTARIIDCEPITGATIDIGINPEINNNQRVRIFPNPFLDILNIELTGFNEYAFIQIFDIQGRLLKTIKSENYNFVVADLASLRAGVYVVRITGKEFMESRRIVKSY